MPLTPIVGFCSGSYESRARGESAQRTVNWRLEHNKPGSKTEYTLYRRPGKQLFGTFPSGNVNGMTANRSRVFAVCGPAAYELLPDGTSVLLGPVAVGTNPATMRFNRNQLLICSAGNVYLATGTTLFQPIVNFANGNVDVAADGITVSWVDGDKFTIGDPESDIVAGNAIMIGTVLREVAAVASDISLTLTVALPGAPLTGQAYYAGSGTAGNPTCLLTGATCAFVDGYFIVNTPNTKQFRISNLNNGGRWDELDQGEKSSSTDNIARVMELGGQLALIGDTNSTEIWSDSGNPDFPFAPIKGRNFNIGADAAWSVAELPDGSLAWLMNSEQGGGVVVRTTGGEPERISDHGIENEILGYAKIFDAVGSTYLEEGHAIYRLDFPTANKTWEFDATSGAWTEIGSATDIDESYAADLGRFRVYVTWPDGRRMHLAGDYSSGKVWQVSPNFADDDGVDFPLMRIAPHVGVNLERLICKEFALDCELGTVDPSLVGPDGRALIPTIGLSFSDDGARTWTDVGPASLGRTGEYDGTYLTAAELFDTTPSSQTNPQVFEALPRWFNLGDFFISKTFKLKTTGRQMKAIYDGLIELGK